MPNNISPDFTVTADGVEVTEGLGWAGNDIHTFLTAQIDGKDENVAALRKDGTFDVFRHGYKIIGKFSK